MFGGGKTSCSEHPFCTLGVYSCFLIVAISRKYALCTIYNQKQDEPNFVVVHRAPSLMYKTSANISREPWI